MIIYLALMRMKIEFSSDDEVRLPIHHNHIIQGVIYSSISSKLAKMLHDKGFEFNNRRFKLFTFSRIEVNFRVDRKENTIVFGSPFRLVISSALNRFIEELGNEMLRKERLNIGKNTVRVNSIEISNSVLSDKNRIKILSPITIYSTLKKADGKKKTYYYSPFEEEFSHLVSENAKKKFKAFHQVHPRKLLPKNVSKSIEVKRAISLSPVGVRPNNQKIVNYKGTIIKGWMGIYELSGDPELMKMVYDAGLGGKNSQGFGCFEVLG